MQKMLGTDIILESLISLGVDTVFGYPGGQVIPLYDSLYRYSDKVKHILTAHEQGASHAADGYARSTGKVGVCIATSGPGATNIVTGIATAYADSVPLVAITGNVPLTLFGKDSFQEVDIAGISLPITKHNYIVKDIAELEHTIKEAFIIAKEGRPGPVLIDIPKNVQTDSYEYKNLKVSSPIFTPKLKKSVIDKAEEIIRNSKKPIIYIGGGVIRDDADKELREFAKLIDAPVASSLMGLGVMKSSDERFTGMIGMHGTKVSNVAINESDLLVVIGARFSDRTISNGREFAKKANVIHMDVDLAEFNKNILSNLQIACSVKEGLVELIKRFKDKPLVHKEWMGQISQYKKTLPTAISKEAQRAKEIIDVINSLVSDKDFISTEVGQHQMWAAQFLNAPSPHHFLTSGGLGTMGYGLGACIGAQIAHPKSRCINIAGDGCIRMNVNELATIARYKLPIIEIIMNNHCLGMVRQWQNLFFNKHYSQTTLDTPVDWTKIAEGYGLKGMTLSLDDDVKKVLKSAFDMKEAVIIDCQIPTDDFVLPMVAPGAAISQMITDIDN